ncbi:acyl-CoA dehydrogenase family protein [Amycolatopsis sp. GM8]|uniref:acyl-CoA dehydrogenase family protein n=1 Tax=Amycolatopsis sp. GM8 TaxID=2896530 RepID=UPI001F1B6266|nr:acyl-CoA dehydrogenase family protein [Amycolatopsis sp. GM8]
MTDPMATEEARALRGAVRALLAKRSDVRAAIGSPLGYDDKLWSTLCEQIGVAALAVPEDYGGAGATLAEVCVVQEELGRTLTPSPMLGSVLAVEALLATGNDEACHCLLPGIAAGATIAAVAWSGEDGSWTPACVATESTVDGRAHYVLDAGNADVILALARTPDSPGLFEIAPEAARRSPTPAMDPTRQLGIVELTGAAAQRLDHGGYPLARVRDTAVIALAAEQVGAAARALEITVDHTKQRHQFGRPIGSFQALKHRMADVYVHIEQARSALHAALADGTDLSADAATAKIVCSEAFEHAAAEMIQLHGGIAITWEHDAHLYFKRAHASARLFGSPAAYVVTLDM